MNAQNWTDTLTLLSIMILADEKIYQEEVQSFQHAAVALRDIINPKLMLTEHMAKEWFVVHRDEIQTRMSPLYHEDTVSILLNSLKELPNCKDLLLALIKISMSDGLQHTSEQKLISRARSCWKLPLAS